MIILKYFFLFNFRRRVVVVGVKYGLSNSSQPPYIPYLTIYIVFAANPACSGGGWVVNFKPSKSWSLDNEGWNSFRILLLFKVRGCRQPRINIRSIGTLCKHFLKFRCYSQRPYYRFIQNLKHLCFCIFLRLYFTENKCSIFLFIIPSIYLVFE